MLVNIRFTIYLMEILISHQLSPLKPYFMYMFFMKLTKYIYYQLLLVGFMIYIYMLHGCKIIKVPLIPPIQ